MKKMPRVGKGWPETVHPVHVHAVDALTGKIKLGTKKHPALSNRQIHTLLDLDMKTVKALKENKAYRERVLARKGPLRPSKEDMLSPILEQLKELRERVKALEPPAPAAPEPEATEALNDGGEGEGEITGAGDEPPVDGPGDAPGPSGEPGKPEPEAAKEFFPLGK